MTMHGVARRPPAGRSTLDQADARRPHAGRWWAHPGYRRSCPVSRLGQLGGQLNALGFAARKRGSGADPAGYTQGRHPASVLQLTVQILGMLAKKTQRLLHRHIQHVGNALALVLDFQRFAVVALAFADLAGHVDVRQESAFHICKMPSPSQASQRPPLTLKLKRPAPVAAHLGVAACLANSDADVREHTGVRGRVGARCAPNGRLVDADDLVHPLHALDGFALAGAAAGTVQRGRQRLVQNFVDQRGFAGTGHAGHADHLAQREIHSNVLQVVLVGFDHPQELAVAGTAVSQALPHTFGPKDTRR